MQIFKKFIISLSVCMMCFLSFVPALAKEKDTSGTTNGKDAPVSDSSDTNSSDKDMTTRQKAELKYEILARITMKYDDGQIKYDEIHVGELIKEPEVQTKKGYEFLGWYNEETGEKWDFSAPVKNHTTLVAKYKKLPAKSANTSDKTNIYIWGGVFTLSLLCAVIAVTRKKSE